MTAPIATVAARIRPRQTRLAGDLAPASSKRRIVAAMLAIAAILPAGCTLDAPPLRGANGPTSVRVVIPADQRGTVDARLPFSLEPVLLTVDLEVIDRHGQVDTDFTGWLAIGIEPGDLVSVVGDGVISSHVPLTQGAARGITVGVAKAFSDARLWVEDIGYQPAEPGAASCANGRDDDGDGRIDFPDDTGCRYANDDTEEPGSHAAGVSDLLYFENPRLADVQGGQGNSPLDGRRVQIAGGQMIVTRITSDGFYVSDIARGEDGTPTGQAIPWGSLFVFSYSTPPFLRACDRIVSLSGSVGEFFGFTELNFPFWDFDPWCAESGDTCVLPDGTRIEPSPCLIPEPAVLETGVIGTAAVEQHESALVRLVDVVMPTRMGPEPPPVGSNCDLDGDGNVSLTTGSPERDCLSACDADAGCTEWNQFVEFGQFAVQSAGANINVVTRDSVPDFDPLEHLGGTFAAMTGTLRHFAPLGLERGYILEPRCAADLVETGDPVPSNSACVTPRTGGPIEVE